VAQWQFVQNSPQASWAMLKSFILDPTGNSIELEQSFQDDAISTATEKHEWVTKFELSRRFGKGKEARAFIDQLLAGQKGVAHPQCPGTLVFKVLKELSTASAQQRTLSNRTTVRGEVGDDPAARALFAEKLEAQLLHI